MTNAGAWVRHGSDGCGWRAQGFGNAFMGHGV